MALKPIHTTRRPGRICPGATTRPGSSAWPPATREGALESFRSCESVIARLTASNPDNAQYGRAEASCQERIAEVLLVMGEPVGAMMAYERALEIARDRADRARLFSALGEVLAETQDSAKAELRLREARALYASLLAAQPENASVRKGLAKTLQRLSRLMAAAGNAEAALTVAQEAANLAGDDDSVKTYSPPGADR